MPIWLTVNAKNGIPIYVQIVEQVKRALEVGILQPGERLPTVRQLAIELTIAPNTIVKAYNELQLMDLVESKQGVGTVVKAGINDSLRKQHIATLNDRLREIVQDAYSLGVTREELCSSFQVEVERRYPVEKEER